MTAARAPGRDALLRPAHHPVQSAEARAAMLVRRGLAQPGRPLDTATRRLMEPQLGHDLGRVRLHADQDSAEAARALGARAYTAGQHVFFDAGQAAPGSDPGRRTMAHELVHVVQQARGPVAGRELADGVRLSTPQDRFEQSARAQADAIATGRGPAAATVAPLPASAASAGVAVQRDGWDTAGAIAGIAGAALAVVGLGIAIAAWLRPRNANATAQGVTLQPNPFQFTTLGDTAAAVPDTPEARQQFETASSAAPRTDPILELRTDDADSVVFNLQSNTDGHNIISAGVSQGEASGYQGGYDGSLATVVLSETQTFPLPKGAVAPAPPAPAAAPAPSPPAVAKPAAQGKGKSRSKGVPNAAAGSTAAPAAPAPAPAPAAEIARVVIHFSGTNGKTGSPLQRFAGEINMTGAGALQSRGRVTNGIGSVTTSGAKVMVDYRTPRGNAAASTPAPTPGPGATPAAEPPPGSPAAKAA